MFHLIFLTFLFLLSSASPLHALFSSWQFQHNRTYDSEEERWHRFSIFKENIKRIEQHNADPMNTFKMKMNRFGDLLYHEFKSKYSGAYSSLNSTSRPRRDYHDTSSLQLQSAKARDYPRNVDWADPKLHKMSSVKDQLYCGGCWAFAVADAVESRFAIKHQRNVVELSIQELIDCDHKGVNEGCVGGNLPEGYDYVIERKGLCTSHDYKFTGYDDHCKRHKCKRRSGRIRDYGIVIPDNEVALREAVARGPVAIAIEADAEAMQFYDHGILTTKKCGVNVDHAVTIVGYGEDRGIKYWKIKNSWSSDWGEGGYMRLCRECGRNGKTGECGITVEAVFPIV